MLRAVAAERDEALSQLAHVDARLAEADERLEAAQQAEQVRPGGWRVAHQTAGGLVRLLGGSCLLSRHLFGGVPMG